MPKGGVARVSPRAKWRCRDPIEAAQRILNLGLGLNRHQNRSRRRLRQRQGQPFSHGLGLISVSHQSRGPHHYNDKPSQRDLQMT